MAVVVVAGLLAGCSAERPTWNSLSEVLSARVNALGNVLHTNETKDDPSGAEELAAIAKSIGRQGEDLMSDASRQWSEVERNRDDARRFSANDGRWSGVRSNLHQSAEAIARAWKDDWDNAKRACEEVVKRERHREVEKVLGRLSNSRAGRAELRKKLDELVAAIADRVKDVDSHSDNSRVGGALELAKELESQLERLGNAAGDDGASRRIASTWPAWVRELRGSLEPLKELKLNQYRADNAAGKCEAAERALDDRIKQLVDDRDKLEAPDKELAEEAERVGTPIEAGMKSAEELDRTMGDWANKARSFGQTEGAWSQVTSNLRDSAARVLAHWRDKLGAASKACANVMRGKDHPKVKAAIEQLRGKTGSEADQLEREVGEWVERARATYRLDCDAMKDMWEAYCGTDWEPNDSEPGERAKQTAAYLQDKMQAAMAPILRELPALDQRVKKLTAKAQSRSRGQQLQARLDKESARLRRLVVSERWHGSNDPIRFYAAEYGKQQHARLWSDKRCDVPLSADKRARFPGSGHTDPDCVVAERCEVWEFKPDSPTGQAEGREQQRSYASIVGPYYTERHRNNEPAADFLGGAAIMKTLAAKCLQSGAIRLQVNVEHYRMCDNRYECVRGD